jgi:hypothetical protein
MKILGLFAACAFAILAMLIATSCGGSDDSPAEENGDDSLAQGKDGGPCYPNNTCDAGLACENDVCTVATTDDDVSDDDADVSNDDDVSDDDDDTVDDDSIDDDDSLPPDDDSMPPPDNDTTLPDDDDTTLPDDDDTTLSDDVTTVPGDDSTAPDDDTTLPDDDTTLLDDDSTIPDDDTTCTPNCAGKECGGDGCGGSCGTCGEHDACQEGACNCEPWCEHNQCGEDGCGGFCGECEEDIQCLDGIKPGVIFCAELCNGIDDDLNGEVDDIDVCLIGAILGGYHDFCSWTVPEKDGVITVDSLDYSYHIAESWVYVTVDSSLGYECDGTITIAGVVNFTIEISDVFSDCEAEVDLLEEGQWHDMNMLTTDKVDAEYNCDGLQLNRVELTDILVRGGVLCPGFRESMLEIVKDELTGFSVDCRN